MARDSVLRGLSAMLADPFYDLDEYPQVLPGNRLPEYVSAHDHRCFASINESLL